MSKTKSSAADVPPFAGVTFTPPPQPERSEPSAPNNPDATKPTGLRRKPDPETDRLIPGPRTAGRFELDGIYHAAPDGGEPHAILRGMLEGNPRIVPVDEGTAAELATWGRCIVDLFGGEDGRVRILRHGEAA